MVDQASSGGSSHAWGARVSERMCACRYVYHTLRNSRHSVATIDEADVVYVHDYCYMMWILSDHHSREHWWLRSNYQPELKTGSYLLSSYRRARRGLPLQGRACGHFLTRLRLLPGLLVICLQQRSPSSGTLHSLAACQLHMRVAACWVFWHEATSLGWA